MRAVAFGALLLQALQYAGAQDSGSVPSVGNSDSTASVPSPGKSKPGNGTPSGPGVSMGVSQIMNGNGTPRSGSQSSGNGTPWIRGGSTRESNKPSQGKPNNDGERNRQDRYPGTVQGEEWDGQDGSAEEASALWGGRKPSDRQGGPPSNRYPSDAGLPGKMKDENYKGPGKNIPPHSKPGNDDDLSDCPSWCTPKVSRRSDANTPLGAGDLQRAPVSAALGGFHWPTKKSSPTDKPSPSPADHSWSAPNDNSHHGGDDVKPKSNTMRPKGPKPTNGGCPAKCLAPRPNRAWAKPAPEATSTSETPSPSTSSVPSSADAMPTNPPPMAPPMAPPSGDASAAALTSQDSGNTCPQQCDPFDPSKNNCGTGTSCLADGAGKYYCACPGGTRPQGVDPKDQSKQFVSPAFPYYVFVTPGSTCDQRCDNPSNLPYPCAEIPQSSQCA